MLNFMWREPTNAHDSEALFHLREWQRSSSSTAPYQGPQNRPFGVIIKLWPLTSICASCSAALAPLPLTRVHKIDHSVQKVFRKYMRVTVSRLTIRVYTVSPVSSVSSLCVYMCISVCARYCVCVARAFASVGCVVFVFWSVAPLAPLQRVNIHILLQSA